MRIKIQRPDGSSYFVDTATTPVAIQTTAKERERLSKPQEGDVLMYVPPDQFIAKGQAYWVDWGGDGWFGAGQPGMDSILLS